MDSKSPAGENRPPQITAPQNEPDLAVVAGQSTGQPTAPAGPKTAATPAQTPPPLHGTQATQNTQGAFPAGAEIPLHHGQPLPAMAGAAAANTAALGAAPAAPAAPGTPGGFWAIPPAGTILAGGTAPTVKVRQPFTAGRADGLFALACFALGFVFLRWGLGLLNGGGLLAGMQGWGVGLFCLLWGVAVTLYAKAKRVAMPRESWYWLAILLLCGASFALWPAGLLAPYRTLLTLGAAVYFCGHLLGVPLAGKTSNLLPLDAINMLFVVPVRNTDCVGKSLKSLGGGGAGGRGGAVRKLLPVAAGLLLCIPLLFVVVPLLASADSGNFSNLLRNISAWFREWALWETLSEALPSIAIQLLLAVPVGMYLFGLGAGGAHRRYTRTIDAKKAKQQVDALRLVPAVTVLVVLGVVCAVYAVFIGCQLPYFFSAFAGAKPGQYAVYSEYAREGFFELCRIAALNLGLLALAGVVCRRSDPDGKIPGIRLFNILLSALTVLVIATAFSKMGLYIVRHGFTPKRLMTCVFMLFLAGVCGAVIALQYKKFSIVRFAAVSGAGLLCALCLCNLDGLVVRYNADAWQAGKLETFDELIVARGGPAGAETAMAVYDSLDETKLAEAGQKLRLAWALYRLRDEARATEGTSRDTLANSTARWVIDLPMTASEAEQARAVFEAYYAAQLERGGYE